MLPLARFAGTSWREFVDILVFYDGLLAWPRASMLYTSSRFTSLSIAFIKVLKLVLKLAC